MTLRGQGRRGRRRGTGPSRGSALIVVAALVGVNYFLFFQEKDEAAPPSIEERLDLPAQKAVAPASEMPGAPSAVPGQAAPGEASPQGPARGDEGPKTQDRQETDDFGEPIGRKVAGKLKRGQTVIKALEVEGLDNRTALPIIRAMENVFDFRQARVGNEFKAWVDDEGQVKRFVYEASPLDVFEVTLMRDGSYSARKKAVPTRVEVAKLGCAIKSSLYESIRRCGEGTSLAGVFIDLFAWDVDFFQDVRQGDEFRVMVEKISVDGKFLKYGRVLAAEYRGKFGRHQLVHYTSPEGSEGYYTPAGRAVRKEFLKSPLKYTMVSAGGRSAVRGSIKKAGPVVYTAKRGTPVWAVAGGRVVFAGKSGKLGLTVTIQHDDGVTSTYGNLAKLGRGVKVGATVNQKTVLGSVGRSRKTGKNELFFSLRKRGRPVNALRMNTTEADPIPRDQREHFEGVARELLNDLESTPIIGINERRS